MPSTDDLLAVTIREESGRLVASLSRRFGDFDVAEEAVQGAVVEALTAWRRSGPPQNPAAWLTTAATRNALDLLRGQGRQQRLAERVAPRDLVSAEDQARGDVAMGAGSAAYAIDERMDLLFACCHPGLAVEARLALTLRAVVGLTTAQIARAFLTSEATLAQRIVRAKRKIATAGIALEVPDLQARPERLADVLAVVYLMYNEAFVSTTGRTQDRDLGADAVWLATLVAQSLPGQAEVWGLAALLTIQHARSVARFDASGDLVLLRDQDRRLWDASALDRAQAMLSRAAALRRTGPYQLQAAIAAVHAEAPTWRETDWVQIAALYEALAAVQPSAVTRLNRAVALAHVPGLGAAKALAEVDALAPGLSGYHLFHATRAELLRDLGRADEAAVADRRALALTTNEAERRLLQTRLRRHPLTDGS